MKLSFLVGAFLLALPQNALALPVFGGAVPQHNFYLEEQFLYEVASHGIAIPSGPTTTSAAIVGFNSQDFPFVNFVKPAGFTWSGSGIATPNYITANQYPTGTMPSNYEAFDPVPPSYFGKYVLVFNGSVSGGSGLQFADAFTGTIYSTTGSPSINSGGCTPQCTILNGVGFTGSNFTVTFDLSEIITNVANNGSGLIRVSIPSAFNNNGNYATGKNVTINGVVGSDGNGCSANGLWVVAANTTTYIDLANSTFPVGGCTYVSGGQAFPYRQDLSVPEINLNFSSGATFTGVTGVCIAKLADYNADNTCNTTAGKTAWPGGFNDDFVQSLAKIKPRYLRYLDVNAPFSGAPDFANYAQSSWMSYGQGYPLPRWFGIDSTHTNSYAVTCASPCTYALTGGAPADGDTVIAQIINNNTSLSTTLTVTDINGVTSSALPIVDGEGQMNILNFAAGVVTGAADNGSGLIRLTLANSISNGATVSVSGIAGCTGANGNWVVSGASSSTIDLVGTSSSGCAYTSGGAVIVVGDVVTVTLTSSCILGGSTAATYTTKNSDTVSSIFGGINNTLVGATFLGSQSLATTTALPNSPTYSNGSSGVGATLTAGSNTTLTVDGVALSTLGTSVLVMNQASTFQNGVYTITTLGSGSTPWVLTRATYFDTPAQMVAAIGIPITSGTVNAGQTFILQNTVATVGTTPVLFNVSTAPLPLGLSDDGSLGSPNLGIRYAIQACALSVAGSSTSGTEVLTYGFNTIGSLGTSAIHLFNYNALMERWVDIGTRGAWPWLIQIQLANAVSTAANTNTGCWLQTNMLWSLASHAALDSYVISNPCTGGYFHELSNEVWLNSNLETHIADNIGSAIGLNPSQNRFPRVAYLTLRSSQIFQASKIAFAAAGQASAFHGVLAFQDGNVTAGNLNGNGLCGTSCSNTAYQNGVGTDYNTLPTQPHNFIVGISQAPYYYGNVLGGGLYGQGTYSASSAYGTWSSTSAGVASNVLTIGGTITGTIVPNSGIAGCDGTYIANPTPTNWASGQLTGTVLTTLSITPSTATWTIGSTAGLSTGMWAYDATTGFPQGTISSIGSGTVTLTGSLYIGTGRAVAGDNLVFGGKAGTYQLNTTTCSIASASTIAGGDVLGLQYAADNYSQLSGALGSQQDGLNWVYQDALVSVINGSMPGNRTVWSIIANFNIANNVGGYGLPVIEYEGGYQSTPPTAAQATAMGLPSAAYGVGGLYSAGNGATAIGGYVDAVMYGFKTSSLLQQMETFRHNTALAIEPSGSVTTKFNFETASSWSAFPLNLYYPPPYTDYKAICIYNGGSSCFVFLLPAFFRRRRRPSNDNDPMWLEKAA